MSFFLEGFKSADVQASPWILNVRYTAISNPFLHIHLIAMIVINNEVPGAVAVLSEYIGGWMDGYSRSVSAK